MTFEQAFEKAAMERFEEVKMASLGALLKNMGGFTGIKDALGAGTIGSHLGTQWNALSPEAKAKALGALSAGTTGALYGYFQGDKRDSVADRLLAAGLYGAGAGIGGHYLGGQIHGFRTPSGG